MEKRTDINFSKHEVLITEGEGLLIHYLKKPDTVCDSIKFINVGGILAVTGDYGNWIFCREFHPSAKGGVSDGYWKEKLHIASTQQANEYDPDLTRSELQKMIDGGAEEYGYSGNRLKEVVEYYKESMYYVDDEFEYTHYAYRNHPSFMDSESVIMYKQTKYWLKAVFDGFDEICRRMKIEEQNPERSVATQADSSKQPTTPTP